MWINWGYDPNGFWLSHPRDFWQIIEAQEEKRKHTDRSRYAGMTEAEVEAIYQQQVATE